MSPLNKMTLDEKILIDYRPSAKQEDGDDIAPIPLYHHSSKGAAIKAQQKKNKKSTDDAEDEVEKVSVEVPLDKEDNKKHSSKVTKKLKVQDYSDWTEEDFCDQLDNVKAVVNCFKDPTTAKKARNLPRHRL